MKSEFASDVFANPKDGSFASSINQIYQTFDGKDILLWKKKPQLCCI